MTGWILKKTFRFLLKKKVKIDSKWKVVRIGQIAQTQYGFTDKASNIGKVRYLRITDLNDDGTIKPDNQVFINPDEEIEKQFLLRENDIVIAKSGSVGKSAIYKSDKYDRMVFASYLIRLTTDVEKALPQYLFNFTKTKMYWNQVEANSIAVTQPNLNAEKIKEFLIPLPPLNIQQKIVSEIEELEKQEKETLEEIEKKTQGIVLNFNKLKHKNVPLGSITSFKNGLNYNRQSLGELITIVGVGDFKDDFFPKLNNLDKIQIEGKLSEEYELKPEDILVVRSNGSARLVGRFLYIDKLESKASFSGFTIRIRVDSKEVESKFLCHYLRTDIVRNKLTIDSKGSNIKSLNQKLLSSIKIPLPTISEQKKIISEIEKTEKEIADLEKQIDLLPKQKEAILKKYLVLC